MKLGTQIRLPDGREGTVVYNSLIGVGIKWGLHSPNPKDFEGTNGDTTAMIGGHAVEEPVDFQWHPDALLRDPWDGCERDGFDREDCVGDDFEIMPPREDSDA